MPLATAALVLLGGCDAGLSLLASIGVASGLAAMAFGRDRQRRALAAGDHLPLALGPGDHRAFEHMLRRQLALATGGHGVGPDREWATRLELGALLLAEWRLDEARELYLADKSRVSIEITRAIDLRVFELNVISHAPDDDTLAAIVAQREAVLGDAKLRWQALEGLTLTRMGRAREGAAALETGLPTLHGDPVVIVYLFYLAKAYQTLGDRALASRYYQHAEQVFPGTKLASEAAYARRALDGTAAGGPFRPLLAPGDDDDPT